MRLKCPHCRAIVEFEQRELRVFVVCRRCGKEFRPAAASPVISGDVLRATGSTVQTGGVFSSPGSQDWANFTRKGMRFFHLRMYDKAEEEFRRSIEINRDQPQVMQMLNRIQEMAQAEW